MRSIWYWKGYVSGRPLVGISVSSSQQGLVVAGVQSGSGAEKAGLQVGDLIAKVDGTFVKSADEFLKQGKLDWVIKVMNTYGGVSIDTKKTIIPIFAIDKMFNYFPFK